MKPRCFQFVFTLFFLLALGLTGCLNSHDLKPGFTVVRKPKVVIPAKILGNQFIIETKWDRHGPWRFIIDTGSSVTLVSQEFARRYASDAAALAAPAVHVRSADGKATMLPAVTIGEIELGAARFENVQALLYNFDDLSTQLGVKIDGVLGFPLFRETVFTLDYPQSRLVIRPVWPAPEPPDGFGTTIKFNNSQRTPVIPIRLGAENFFALVDSGNDGPLTLNVVGLHPNFISGPRAGLAVGTLSGIHTQEIGRIEQPLDLGPFRFEKPIAELTDQLTSIGGEMLRNFIVTFDETRNQVSFYRDSFDPIASAACRSAGLSFSKAPAYWRVAGVIPGSPAELAGVQAGDLITRINGEPVTDWSYGRYDALVRKAQEITFTFLKGSTETPVVISTFELVP